MYKLKLNAIVDVVSSSSSSTSSITMSYLALKELNT